MSAGAWLTPRRIRGTEYLDSPTTDPSVALRSLQDIRRSNRFFGGRAAVLAEVRAALKGSSGRALTLLDVGTGCGDIPAAARDLAESMGATLRTIGLEWTTPLASAARAQCGDAVTGDARHLPFGDRSVDVVICSQVLHHFADAEATSLLRELHRVARLRVIVGEIRRSWVAAAGLWMVSWPLGFHPVSRHDGVVSVMRGYRCSELRDLVRGATGVVPTARNRPGFRVTASWNPA